MVSGVHVLSHVSRAQVSHAVCADKSCQQGWTAAGNSIPLAIAPQTDSLRVYWSEQSVICVIMVSSCRRGVAYTLCVASTKL